MAWIISLRHSVVDEIGESLCRWASNGVAVVMGQNQNHVTRRLGAAGAAEIAAKRMAKAQRVARAKKAPAASVRVRSAKAKARKSERG